MASLDPAVPAFVRLAGHPLRWRLLTELAHSDLRVRELVALIDEPQNLVSYHLRLLRDGGLVTATRSSADGRDSYYHLDLDSCVDGLAGAGAALHPALRLTPASSRGRPGRRTTVLFVCTGNSARSPLAEALLRQRSASGITALSAGTSPKPSLHPNTVRILRDQYGIDASRQRPTSVMALAGRRFDHVITLCDKAREVGLELLGQPSRAHWSIADPATSGDPDKATLAAFARTAAELETRIGYLLPTLTSSNRKEAQS